MTGPSKLKFTPAEDTLLLRLRGDGQRWYEIADRLSWSSSACQKRYLELLAERASAPRMIVAPDAEAVAPVEIASVDLHRIAAETGSRALLAAQLRTGQYFPKARAEWLARHGGDA